MGMSKLADSVGRDALEAIAIATFTRARLLRAARGGSGSDPKLEVVT